MDYAAESLKKHYEWKGKLEMTPRAAVDNKEALSLAYTPGVAQPCLEIQKDVNKSYELTRRWNTVARNKVFMPLPPSALQIRGLRQEFCAGRPARWWRSPQNCPAFDNPC